MLVLMILRNWLRKGVSAGLHLPRHHHAVQLPHSSTAEDAIAMFRIARLAELSASHLGEVL